MSIIDYEIEEIQKVCENVVPKSKIIACNVTLIRVDICENQFSRKLSVILRFPVEGYPKQVILIELKSRTLSDKFLLALTTLCEKQALQHLGNPQGMHVLRFVANYLHENPLCVCFDEIQQLRRELGAEATPDQLKLKQRTSTVRLKTKGGNYFYSIRAYVPDEYPQRCVDLQQPETNLPAVLLRYLNGQSREIARQCVEPPLSPEKRAAAAGFQPQPSLYRALKFCIEATRDFHAELCPICKLKVLPAEPSELELDDANDAFVERVYCGHLFHQGCLKEYLQEPPFPKGGKRCPAKCRHARSDRSYGAANKQSTSSTSSETTCGMRLAHDRWVVNIKVAESRWAQKQARERELEEVVDFLV